jgi:hypothetical protein
MNSIAPYIIGLLLDFGGLIFALFIAETTIRYQRGSLKYAIYASIPTLIIWRIASFVQIFIPSPFFVSLILMFAYGLFVNRFYGDDWFLILGLALIILFAIILVTTSMMAVVSEIFK